MTKREAQVLARLVQGQSNAEIAATLKMSTRTVQKHLEHIYRKLGVRNRTEAAVQAVVRLYRRPSEPGSRSRDAGGR